MWLGVGRRFFSAERAAAPGDLILCSSRLLRVLGGVYVAFEFACSLVMPVNDSVGPSKLMCQDDEIVN